jgi:coniferyl-aldehyde dehydrogenase
MNNTDNALQTLIRNQQHAVWDENHRDVAPRKLRIKNAMALLNDNAETITTAIHADFGNRATAQSLMVDVLAPIGALKHALKHVEQWMHDKNVAVESWREQGGASAHVQYQPLGSVGVMSPWNFPVNLVFSPLASIFAAGNRAIIKPSELTPRTSQLMAELARKYFAAEELTVIEGGADVAARFAAQPFDHLLYTGGGEVAKKVMQAASANLTPVTLELGGKCPVIIDAGANAEQMARDALRIMTGKLLNAGQICLAPDYLLLPRAELNHWITALKTAAQTLFPQFAGNPLAENGDYCAIINARHFDRLSGLLADATQHGARIETIADAADNASMQILMPRLVINPGAAARILHDEIFGPLLPIVTYDDVTDAIGFVRARPKPLALYLFSSRAEWLQRLTGATASGGVSINDVIAHYQIEDLPFGGVGYSGMGVYHGFDGFRNFSHARAVYAQVASDDIIGLLRPPYNNPILQGYLQSQIKKPAA